MRKQSRQNRIRSGVRLIARTDRFISRIRLTEHTGRIISGVRPTDYTDGIISRIRLTEHTDGLSDRTRIQMYDRQSQSPNQMSRSVTDRVVIQIRHTELNRQNHACRVIITYRQTYQISFTYRQIPAL